MRACGVRGSSGLYEKSAEAWDRVVLPRNRLWALENWRLALLAIAAYHEAILRAAEYGDPEIERLLKRQLAQSDLFFLLVYVLGRADLNRDWYFARCREVQAAPNGYLDLWGREHGKSSLITFGLTIQDILNDPEITVGIFSYSRPIAKAFLRQIKVEFENNETLKSLFPDILWTNPQRDSPKFSEDDGIIVRRKGNPKESTVEAWDLWTARRSVSTSA